MQVKPVLRSSVVIGALLFLAGHSCAQPGSLDASFGPPLSFQRQVSGLALQTDGRVVLSALYPVYGGRIERLNANGSSDSTFLTTELELPGESVFTLALDESGRIVLGGSFTEIQGQNRNRLARLTSGGALDTTFDAGAGPDGDVLAMTIQSDGRILIGGRFATVNGISRRGVARLHANGSVDLSFDPGAGPDTNDIRAIKVLPDGKVIVAGAFSVFGGTNRNHIARLNGDGSLDLSFDSGAGPNQIVNALAVQPDGKLLLGGHYDPSNPATPEFIVRLNADGSRDPAFNSGLGISGPPQPPGSPPISTVETIVLQPDGGVFVAGYFDFVDGLWRRNLARLNVDGSLDYNFDVNSMSFLGNPGVQALAMQPDGRLLIGGGFSYIENVQRDGLARLNTAMTNFAGRLEFAAARYRVQEGAGVITLTVRRAAGSVGAVSVSYFTSGNTAQSPSDYRETNGVLNFAAGETNKTFTITIVNDALGEDGNFHGQPYEDERFSVGLIGFTGGAILGSQHTAFIDIEDDDTSFTFTSPDFTAGELDGRGIVRVRRTGTTNHIRAVVCATGSGTATAGADYVAHVATLTFRPGETLKELPIVILEDELTEGAETVNVTLSSPSNGATLVPPSSTTLKIEDRPGTVVSTWPGAVDTSFYPGPWLDGSVGSLAVGADGKIVVSGAIYVNSGAGFRYLARLHPDGSLDETFNAPPTLNTSSLLLQPDGRAIVGDDRQIVRLNTDGSVDASFSPASFPTGGLQLIRRQPDGRLIIAGSFTNVNGVARQWIARLNGNGSLDASFDPGSVLGQGMSPGPGVYDVAVQTDGKLLVVGDVNNVPRLPRPAIIRLLPDGRPDPSFDVTVVTGTATRLALQTDGKIVVAGLWLSVNGGPATQIVRLNSDGTLDNSFNPGSGTAGEFISVIAVQTDGKLVIGGGFSTFNGIPRIRLARLNPDGSLDVTFDSGTGPTDYPQAMALQPDGGILIGGDFGTVNGRLRWGIARLIGGDPPAAAPYIKNQPSGETIIEGADALFNVVAIGFPMPAYQWFRNDQPIQGATAATLNLTNVAPSGAGIYRVEVRNSLGTAISSNVVLNVLPAPNQPGAVDLSFRADTATEELPDYTFTGLKTFALQGDGKVVGLAVYSRAGRSAQEQVVRWNSDGTLDSTFIRFTNFFGDAQAIAIQPDGKVLIGGYFFYIEGIARPTIARLNADGTIDLSFMPAGASYYIEDIVVQADGRILIAGQFDQVGGQPRRTVARLNNDGSLDNSFIPPSFLEGALWLALQSDGKVVVGGNLVSDGLGNRRSTIRRLNSDGSLDPAFYADAAADLWVSSAALEPNGKILIAGHFARVNGTTRPSLARLNENGLLDTSFNPGAAADAPVEDVLRGSDGKVLVAGSFTNFNGVLRPKIARLIPGGSLDAGFNPGAGANDRVDTLALQSDGSVLIGGMFTSVDGRPRIGIARLLNDATAAGGALEFTSPRISVSENAGGNVSLKVRRVGAHNGPVTVNYAVSGGSATVGADFLLGAGTLTFGDGDTNEQTIEVSILDDAAAEGDETIEVWLANPIGGATLGAQAATEIVIVEDDTAVGLLVNNGEVNESAGAVAVQVRRYGRISSPFSVHFGTSNSTALASADYIGQDSILHFAPGETNQTILIVLLEDQIAEADETFHSHLANPIGAHLATNVFGTVTIRDNDRPGTLDTTLQPTALFIPGPYSSSVNALALQPDGRILVAGYFWTPIGSSPVGVIRLFADGALDSSFEPGGWSDGLPVVRFGHLIALQPDGKVLVAHQGLEGRLDVVRFNEHGYLDDTFSSPRIEGEALKTLVLQPDGKILIGGAFTRINEVQRNGIARLRSDGSLDSSFNPGNGAVLIAGESSTTFPGTVNAIALTADGRILIGGHFDMMNGTARRCLARLSTAGAVDTAFDIGSGVAHEFLDPGGAVISALAVQPDGRVLIAGSFTHVDGISCTNLARLDEFGRVDLAFNSLGSPCGLFSGIFSIQAIAVQPDGRILIGGAFCGQGRCLGLLRLNANGLRDDTFDLTAAVIPCSYLPPVSTRAVVIEPDGQILIGGSFWQVAQVAVPGIARLNGGVFHFEFRSLSPLPTGRVRLTFSMPRGQNHVLQASSDLVNWLDLNAASPLRDQNEFTDSQATGAPKRFYRVRPVTEH